MSLNRGHEAVTVMVSAGMTVPAERTGMDAQEAGQLPDVWEPADRNPLAQKRTSRLVAIPDICIYTVYSRRLAIG